MGAGAEGAAAPNLGRKYATFRQNMSYFLQKCCNLKKDGEGYMEGNIFTAVCTEPVYMVTCNVMQSHVVLDACSVHTNIPDYVNTSFTTFQLIIVQRKCLSTEIICTLQGQL